jgi:hypothetical protein
MSYAYTIQIRIVTGVLFGTGAASLTLTLLQVRYLRRERMNP